MGAILVHQPASGQPAASEALARARAFFETEKALRPSVADAGGTVVVKYERENGTGAAVAEASGHWLASLGHWQHRDVADPNDNSGLLRLAIARGDDVFDGLCGAYVVVWVDSARERVTVLTEPFGRQHVFVSTGPGGAWISTSPVAIARATGARPDPTAIWQMLTSFCLYEDRSLFEGVHRVEGASVLRFEGGRLLDRRRAHRVPPVSRAPERGSVRDAAAVYDRMLRQCVRASRRVVADLTGGYDTRNLLGFLRRAGVPCELSVAGAHDHPDVRVATRLARALGTPIRVHASPEVAEHASMDSLLRSAARADGRFDTLEVDRVLRVQRANAADFDLGLNGSGGETWRNGWWTAEHVRRPDVDPLPRLRPKFAGLTVPAGFLDRGVCPEPNAWFRDMLDRLLAGRRDRPAFEQIDFVYLHVLMQCWLGGFASATNEVWSNQAPHLFAPVQDVLLRLPPEHRLDHSALHAALREHGAPFAELPLATGFSPEPLSPGSAIRRAWQARTVPAQLWRRWRDRRARQGGMLHRNAASIRALFANGLADWLHPRTLAIRDLCDARRFERWWETARTAGHVDVRTVGRLITVEHAVRAASARVASAEQGGALPS